MDSALHDALALVVGQRVFPVPCSDLRARVHLDVRVDGAGLGVRDFHGKNDPQKLIAEPDT